MVWRKRLNDQKKGTLLYLWSNIGSQGKVSKSIFQDILLDQYTWTALLHLFPKSHLNLQRISCIGLNDEQTQDGLAIATSLCKFGGDINRENRKGKTPISLVHDEVVRENLQQTYQNRHVSLYWACFLNNTIEGIISKLIVW